MGLGFIVFEHQAIGHILPSSLGEILLAKTRFPSEVFEHGPDDVVFRLAFVGIAVQRETLKEFSKRIFQGIKRRNHQILGTHPGRR